ncbi:hypothetical protein HCN44_005542 [Aphidius gifuensis]|uniref:Uncharacterized protein n=1 Tax=Aphidius gifuensis TaxID=684658 RepID=A0A835CY39_APHGI|nr:ribonuclease P protein subunit p30 [Aphidius gifuensis]KAF7997265.1 hypothetical protein HCN44_005542 [Aphidius gifuensis]
MIPGFFDLCIDLKYTSNENLRQILTTLYEMGYRNVAINQNLDESVLDTDKKKKKKTDDEATKVAIVPLDLDKIKQEFKDKLFIMRRLTFGFSESTKTHILEQQNLSKKFDIYSVLPKNQTALQFACSQLSVDIITFDTSIKPLKFTRKLYLQAVERGIHFEIKYSDVISSQKRSNAFHYSHLFHIYGKSKNVFISSGAQEYSAIRNPYDIINLAALFGLNEVKAKAAILSQCKHLTNRAVGRRYGKCIFTIKVHGKHDEPDDKIKTEKSDTPTAKRIKLS